MIGIKDENGVLQIADFGLGRFHGRDSLLGISPSKVVSSPTYEPPECKLHRHVSRSYDIWSLGCLYPEFITWLLKSAKEIDVFGDFSGRPSSIGISEDNFYTIIKTGDETEAIVREEVVDWVNQLHQHEKCSKLIHDLLDLTVKKLLVIDSKEHARAKALSQQLEGYLQKAMDDKQYLLAPAPWPKPASPTLTHERHPKRASLSNGSLLLQ
ncbi:MAG: hypothetical protein M1839_002117 [Geoglossum umbratile]|nr:MAG: hypothetical protein M1839_002117 [Geoglossum umbratile]